MRAYPLPNHYRYVRFSVVRPGHSFFECAATGNKTQFGYLYIYFHTHQQFRRHTTTHIWLSLVGMPHSIRQSTTANHAHANGSRMRRENFPSPSSMTNSTRQTMPKGTISLLQSKQCRFRNEFQIQIIRTGARHGRKRTLAASPPFDLGHNERF